MKSLSVLFVILLLASCAPKTISTTTASSENIDPALRDGTSFEKAVIAKDIPSEYKWVKEHYPGSSILGQALLQNKGKPYDRLDVKLANGQKTQVYFDISSFFGKF